MSSDPVERLAPVGRATSSVSVSVSVTVAIANFNYFEYFSIPGVFCGIRNSEVDRGVTCMEKCRYCTIPPWLYFSNPPYGVDECNALSSMQEVDFLTLKFPE